MKNNTYKQIWEEIIKYNKITILTHKNPDGDTIGSAIGLKYLILDNTKNIEVKISGDKIPLEIRHLEKPDKVSNNYFQNSQIIILDAPSKERIFDQRMIEEQTIKIDHHPDQGNWKLKISGDYWPATGQMICEMAIENNLIISKKASKNLFVAIYTDTACFSKHIINYRTMNIVNSLPINIKDEIKKIGFTNQEIKYIKKLKNNFIIEGNLGYLISTKEIPNDFWRKIVNDLNTAFTNEVTLIASYISKEKKYRCSLRSKGNFVVNKIAEDFYGGGHKFAAGFFAKNIEIINQVIKLIHFQLNK